MVQWTNLQQTKKFINPMPLYITCEKSGGLHLAEPSLMAGLQAGWLTKFEQGLKFPKLAVDRNIQFSALFSQGTAFFSNFDAFLMLFSDKHFYKLFY